MENGQFLKNSQIFWLGISIALATILSSLIFSSTLVKIKKMSEEVITVTGSAEKSITSDYVVWKAEFTRRDPSMTACYELLEQDLKKVKAYLLSKGIAESEIVLAPVQTSVLYRKDPKGNDLHDIEGYLLSQRVEVRSVDVQKVTDVMQNSTELIRQEIQFISQAPDYFYTRLADLKVEMLAKASENARQRAENMAQSTGNAIQAMRSARMGVFQITPVNSYEISDWGTNDTTSLQKKVTAVVNVSFSIAG